MKSVLVLISFLLWAPLAWAAEVVLLTWPTHFAAPPPKFGSDADALLPMFRIALGTVPEAGIATLALSQPALLGLTSSEAAELLPLIQERYRRLAGSPIYASASSALPYCYAPERATRGFANVYVPDNASAHTPVILFLHGYGGSFLWSQHWLSEQFPNHIIVCPAYGISCGFIPPEYLAEALAACRVHLKFPLSRPCLIGLSAGGFGACRVFVSQPRDYAQLICLAASPPEETLYRFPAEIPARFLSGGTEPFVVSGELSKRIGTIRHRAPGTQLQTIPGGDHFFLLTHPRESHALLRPWVEGGPAGK